MTWPVFFLRPAERANISLRRYSGSREETPPCAAGMGYHNASVFLEERDAPTPTSGYEKAEESWVEYAGDPRWPVKCDACAYEFVDADPRQVRQERLYAGHPSGTLYTLGDAPVGAMWNAWWMAEYRSGFDGMYLVVKTPGGDWAVDDRCSNCTRPDDAVHRCWPRKGDPQQNQVDVRKEHGDTCSAGAGSIIIGGWHGFLWNNELVVC